MVQKLNIIKAAPIEKIGRFSLGTVGSLCHGGPYAIITLKGDRVGWVSFKSRKSKCYIPKHKDFDEAQTLVDEWFSDDSNFDKAANAWNAMNIGKPITLLGGSK